MTNFERVINLVADLGQVTINSINNILNNIIIDIDTYDIYEDMISIGSLNGSEININAADIIDIDGTKVVLTDYVLEFDTK